VTLEEGDLTIEIGALVLGADTGVAHALSGRLRFRVVDDPENVFNVSEFVEPFSRAVGTERLDAPTLGPLAESGASNRVEFMDWPRGDTRKTLSTYTPPGQKLRGMTEPGSSGRHTMCDNGTMPTNRDR